VRDFLPHVLEDQKRIWSFPVKTSSWEKRQSWAMFGLAAASFSLDGRVSREVRNAPELHDFNRALASRPSDVVLAAFPAAVVGMGQLLQNERLTDYGWRSAEAAFDAFLVSAALKAATQRSRPHYDRTYGFWEGGNSFPSGHAAVAWSIAVVTAQRFKEHKWAAWVAYSAAGLVTFARVSSGNHFASDAIVGSLLGFGIGRYVAH
jgi:membrane-associated phospholipid phosphatase